MSYETLSLLSSALVLGITATSYTLGMRYATVDAPSTQPNNTSFQECISILPSIMLSIAIGFVFFQDTIVAPSILFYGYVLYQINHTYETSAEEKGIILGSLMVGSLIIFCLGEHALHMF